MLSRCEVTGCLPVPALKEDDVVTILNSRRGSRVFVLIAILILALNLRTAPASLGVLLSALRDDFAFSTTVGGVLATLPLLCFAVFGSSAIRIVSGLGLHRTTLVSLIVMIVGLVLRAFAQDTTTLIVASVIALGGAAIGNVLLPPLVKFHFPRHVTMISSLYTSGILIGATLGSVATVPVADTYGSWHAGFLLWAATAVFAIIPWLFLLGHDSKAELEAGTHSTHNLVESAHSPLAWAMALFFSLQSAQAYVAFGWMPEIYTDAGLSETSAANMLGIMAAMGIPVSLALSFLLRTVGSTALVWAFGVLQMTGWIGLLYRAESVPWLWAIILGLGGGAFPWVLTMIGLKSRTVDGAGALSGFVQGTGYMLAAAGPLGVGILHELSGGWEVPLLVTASLSIPLVATGLFALRSVSFEDQLRH